MNGKAEALAEQVSFSLRGRNPSLRQHHRQTLARLGLILRRSCHIPIHRKMAQKRLHFERTQIFRMSFVIEQNEAPRPVETNLLGANTVMTYPNLGPHPVEQLGRVLGNHFNFHPRNFRTA